MAAEKAVLWVDQAGSVLDRQSQKPSLEPPPPVLL